MRVLFWSSPFIWATTSKVLILFFPSHESLLNLYNLIIYSTVDKVMQTPSWNNLPFEIRAMVLNNATDVVSLNNLTLADPSLQEEFHIHFKRILESVLKSLPLELQRLLCVLFVLGGSTKVNHKNLERLVQLNLEFDESSLDTLSVTYVEDPVLALRNLAEVEAAVDDFPETFIKCTCRPPPEVQPPGYGNLEISYTERHRIRRALWRVELFHYLPVKIHHDQRVAAMLRSWSYWELEETRCIYNHLEDMLYRDVRNPQVSTDGQPTHPFEAQLPARRHGKSRFNMLELVHLERSGILLKGLVHGNYERIANTVRLQSLAITIPLFISPGYGALKRCATHLVIKQS